MQQGDMQDILVALRDELGHDVIIKEPKDPNDKTKGHQWRVNESLLVN